MTNTKSSFFEKAYNPALQAAIVFAAGLVIMLGGKLVQALDIMEIGERFPWKTAAAFLLFFALFNSVFSLSSPNLNQYWGRSMFSFGGLALASGFLAYLFSSIPINEAGSYRWIFTVLGVGYLVFLSIMGFMKRIVEFAEREEWNSPKQRKRRKP